MKNLAKSPLDSDPKRPTGQASPFSQRRNTDGLTSCDVIQNTKKWGKEIPLTLTTKI